MVELKVVNLHASAGDTKILNGVSLTVKQGEIHAVMGPNGSGKSTLSNVIMGNPKYQVTKGDVFLDGESLLELTPDERARKGLFLAFQQPVEVPGVSLSKFLFNAFNTLHPKTGGAKAFIPLLKQKLELIGVDEDFAKRSVNHGFSGGEKKKAEMLQMAVFSPKIALIDEIDSGLDIDALKTTANAIRVQAREQKAGILVITHYQRILKHLQPDFVHVMVGGKIVKSGGAKLALELEETGYAGVGGKHG